MEKSYYNDEHLNFLKGKIKEIKYALFKSEINSELQLPNNIIQILKVDQDGIIWFLTSCSGSQAKSIDRSFYAYLDFYKKGTECRLQLEGKANIVDDNDEVTDVISKYPENIISSLVLVKMKIMQAEYFESRGLAPVSLMDKLKLAFNQLFLSHPHRIYDFT